MIVTVQDELDEDAAAAPAAPTQGGAGHALPHLSDLHDGDYIVDVEHGIGIFHGLTRLTLPAAEGVEPPAREFLALEYAGGDRVYVPADQADRVHPYVGDAAPALSRVRGRTWANAVARAREQAREVAAQMAALYADREAARGRAAGPDTDRQAQMEAAFPYDETPDQLAAVRQIKRDLEADRPMDRLLVGDVGYGKTEVAVRAAFKVAQDGRQTAVLCPTSVLASQHHETFSQRLSPYGIRIELLSRFRSAAEIREVLAALAAGDVDVVVGTHRLLSDDVVFGDLGLVIVDEEQRFGVAHKEKLKQLRRDVDVLTMTATPIPRTFQMALSGLRDVSVIADPPANRMPVETAVAAYDDVLVRGAIRREIERGGQVFFLHNRVETIEQVAARIAASTPEARVRVAHGQMDENTLEETMAEFEARRFDVLVCTTIIESGIDIPNANTLIVDDADRLGLAQLYQLRGRVGRSDRQAYALFLYAGDAEPTDIARQRLAALQEFSDLGSGAKIALRDLELRGAGSLLGLEQSGPAAAVGLDLFLRMVEGETRRIRGEKPGARLAPLPAVDLPVSSAIPTAYVGAERERLRLYSRLASIRAETEVDSARAQIEARYGATPAEMEGVYALLRLRLRCRLAGVRKIVSEGGRISLILRRGIYDAVNADLLLRDALADAVVDVTPERAVLSVPPERALEVAGRAVETLAGALAARRGRRAPHRKRADA